MKNKPQCEYEQSINRWPYVRRCKSEAKVKIVDHSLDDEATGMLVCSLHADEAAKFGWRRVVPA